MSSSKQLGWYEPIEFIRARNQLEKSSGKFLQFGIVFLLIAFIIAISDWPENISDWGVVASLAITISFIITFALPLILRELPHNVSVTDSAIVVGRDMTSFNDIEYAVVGTTLIEGTEYPVLSFQTKSMQSFTVGISSKVSPTELASILSIKGVRVE